ncbi:hypothetical protein GCM10010384_47090 [Streptomyces djakartensis]|uniref:PPM-type phosphatase domain-containing protein n=1 Tax=Streptomyces djakartensis TaxID=68193 RepID=A0ABQ3A3Y9_9ACTN|nr:hypothetical protein GCM10010384_47090 [Streptomyces djakartensis]
MPRVWDVPVRDSTRVRDARAAAEGAAALAGLDERRTAAAALVATELATNLLKHAEGGQVLIDVVDPPVLRPGGERPRVVQIVAFDHGPGVPDVPAALRDGFSTTGSLGAGLGTCLRLADDFHLHSTPGRGTVAAARVGTTRRRDGAPAGPAVTVRPDGVSGTWGEAPLTAAPGSVRSGGSGRWPSGVPGGGLPGGAAADSPAWADEPASRTGPAHGLPGAGFAGGGAPADTPGSRTAHASGPREPGAGDGGAQRNEPGLRGAPADGAFERLADADSLRGRSVPVAGVRAGGVNIPYAGAEYSGDAWTWVRSGDRVTLMLADGLGHGPEAARASSAAVAALHRWAHLAPAESLRRLHEALRGTRGAAVALAQLDLRSWRLRFAGIGNVGARLRTDGTWRPLLSRPGIVGVHRPATLREEEADWAADRLLILHTDGLPSRWTPPPGTGAGAVDPAVTAAVTIRDASSPARPVRDDTAVAVLTPNPPEHP